MKITQVTFREPTNSNNQELKQIVDLVFDDMIKIRDINLCQSDRGYYIGFPRRKTKDNTYYEIFHCVSKDARNYIYKEIMTAYSVR